MKHVWLIGLAATLPLSGHAQSDTSAGASTARVFVPGDFARFAPRSALDMVVQIPGFAISGSDGSRGFGQAQENVLINGQRLSSKSTSAREALSRIPVSNVEKIEIVDGASLDIPGLSGQVANITAKANGITGTWTYRQRFRENLPPALEWIEVSVNGQNGSLGWTLGVETEPGRGTSTGRENIIERGPDGTFSLREYREESNTFVSDYIGLNGSLNWTPQNGHLANLNASYNLFEPDQRETSSVFTPEGELFRQTVFQFKENEWNSEISGDYEFGLGPGRLKLIGLQRLEHSPTRAKFFGANLDGSEVSDRIFDQTVDEKEVIYRGEYSWSKAGAWDWQLSLEQAENTLESEAEFTRGAAFQTAEPITISDPAVRVEESRTEAFVTHGRQLTPKMRLQVSLGAEQSEITSEGPNGQTRTFTRPKGSASLTWQISDKLTLTPSITRKVGQLNFFDFVSDRDLDQGDDQTGNVEIVPDQRWVYSLKAERDFGDWGAVSAEVFAEDIEDLIDTIPIGRGEGPGNIESASRYAFEVEGTFKFDRLGWTGALLDYEVFVQDTFVDDPVTGETRDFNNSTIYAYELDFRHDIPNTDWAWGIVYETFRDAPRFGRDVRGYFEQPQGFSYGFIEHKDLWGMTGSIFLANLLDSDDNFQRISYIPDRNGQISLIESRSRNFGNILTLRLKGTF